MTSKTKCIKSSRAGRFKVSLLNIKTERNEREVVVIDYGKKVDGEWKHQKIWCSTYDFRNLQNAIEDFHEADVIGDDKSPSDFGGDAK